MLDIKIVGAVAAVAHQRGRGWACGAQRRRPGQCSQSRRASGGLWQRLWQHKARRRELVVRARCVGVGPCSKGGAREGGRRQQARVQESGRHSSRTGSGAAEREKRAVSRPEVLCSNVHVDLANGGHRRDARTGPSARALWDGREHSRPRCQGRLSCQHNLTRQYKAAASSRGRLGRRLSLSKDNAKRAAVAPHGQTLGRRSRPQRGQTLAQTCRRHLLCLLPLAPLCRCTPSAVNCVLTVQDEPRVRLPGATEHPDSSASWHSGTALSILVWLLH